MAMVLIPLHQSIRGIPMAPFAFIIAMAIKGIEVSAQSHPVDVLSIRASGGLYVADGVEHQNYVLLGLRFTYKPVKCLDIFAHLDNITDAKYMINNGYQMPGFTAMGGIKVRF